MAEKIVSFRTRLVRFGLTLAFISVLPLIIVEIQRPWDELEELAGRAQGILSGVAASFDSSELMRMNRFAEDMIATQLKHWEGLPLGSYPREALYQSFNLLLEADEIPTQEQVLDMYDDEELEFEDFSYEILQQSFAVWKTELAKSPGLLEIFRKYKVILVEARRLAEEMDIDISDIYLMFDKGSKDSGYFQSNMAYLLGSYGWTEGGFPGEPFDMKKNDAFNWRESYDRSSGGTPGFHSSKLHDPENWYLPQLDTDEWGTWFTVFYAMEHGKDGSLGYSILNIDLDASIVKKLMMRVAVISAIVLAVVALTIALAATLMSRRLSRPIEALIAGSEAVMAGRTSHVVPFFRNDEFKRLIEVFNQLVVWVGERINLKETLTKLLSEELAEKAAKEGLVLGGEQAECSILFTDFAGFSSISKSMEASEVVDLLNCYFSELIPIIKKHGGFPDKYIGDAIVAIFGAPVHLDDHADRAVRCAVEMQKAMRRINHQHQEEGNRIFEMRIGINSGQVVVGAIGCDLKLEYTSIGETTNLAQRMESACEIGHILISENTYRMIKENNYDAELQHIPREKAVKGYSFPLNTYSIFPHDQCIRLTSGDVTQDGAGYQYQPR